MKLPENVVTIHPYFRVQPGKLDAFREVFKAFIAKTSSEPDCLYYEFTRNGDMVFCREGYIGAKGALTHIENVSAIIAEALKISTLERIEIHGPAAELEQMKAPLAGLNAAWFVYETGLK